MKLYLGVILSVGLLFFGCHNSQPKSEVVINMTDSFKNEKARIAFISDSTETKWLNKEIRSFWIPTNEQQSIIDSLVRIVIAENYKEDGKHLRPETYKNYYRQCVCYTNESGDSIVYINAMCGIDYAPVMDSNQNVIAWRKRDWQHHFINVKDGGDCYFQLKIDLTKRRYLEFYVNGEA